MADPTTSSIGLALPNDFDTVQYDATQRRMSPQSTIHHNTWLEYIGAWFAIAYRFRACAEHDQAFTESIKAAGDAPPFPERYVQERELFGFFVTGLATIESLCYGLYSLAAMIDPSSFPLASPEDRRNVTPKKTAEKFFQVYPGETIAAQLQQLVSSTEFTDWKETRNTLAHRIAPGRAYCPPQPAEWHLGNIPIDQNTTASRRAWLAQTLNALLIETNAFTHVHFP